MGTAGSRNSTDGRSRGRSRGSGSYLKEGWLVKYGVLERQPTWKWYQDNYYTEATPPGTITSYRKIIPCRTITPYRTITSRARSILQKLLYYAIANKGAQLRAYQYYLTVCLLAPVLSSLRTFSSHGSMFCVSRVSP